MKQVRNTQDVKNTFHIIAFEDLTLYTELPGTFTKETTINVADGKVWVSGSHTMWRGIINEYEHPHQKNKTNYVSKQNTPYPKLITIKIYQFPAVSFQRAPSLVPNTV